MNKLLAGVEEFTVAQIQDFMTGKLGRFFFGAFRYNDTFGASHITKFCYHVGGVQINRGVLDVFPSQCSHWNCMDGDCSTDKQAYENDAAKPLPFPKRPR
jgi:hypothetical protein